MAIYSVTTNETQEKVFTWIVQRVNVERATHSLPPLTNDQYFLVLLGSWFQSHKSQYDEEETKTLRSIWASLTDEQKSQIKVIAGV